MPDEKVRLELKVTQPHSAISYLRLALGRRGRLLHGQGVDDLVPQRADGRVRLLGHVEDVLQGRQHTASQPASADWTLLITAHSRTSIAGPLLFGGQNFRHPMFSIGDDMLPQCMAAPGGWGRGRRRRAAPGGRRAAATARPGCAAGSTCLRSGRGAQGTSASPAQCRATAECMAMLARRGRSP